MAAAVVRSELSCSVCREIYTEPVTLPCGHNFCLICIERTWDWQEGIEEDPSCPECRKKYRRRPELNRNLRLRNIAECFLPTQPEQECSFIVCTYCDSPVAAAKSCLHCEASLCDYHVVKHSKSPEHVLTDPTTSFGHRKCHIHKKILEFYCPEDVSYICASCCLVGEHRGHKVELLSVVSEKMKAKLKHILEKLSPEREETKRQIQNLEQSRRKVEEKAAGETERITGLFRDIRERVEALEKQVLDEISKQTKALSLPFSKDIYQLKIKQDKLSRKIHHIEELCNMADPLTVLQADGADIYRAEGGDGQHRKMEYINDVGDLDVGRISETLLTGLAGIVAGIKGWWFPGQEATDLVLDINTAGNYLAVSEDEKTASLSQTDQGYPPSSERFHWCQVLSTRSFSSGRHYWELEIKDGGSYWVGAAYPSIERKGIQSWIWNSNKSWGLYREYNNIYSVIHDRKESNLNRTAQCDRIRISVDYEAGHLSFYELSDPIRHLHTFTASFTEPLHAAFWVGWPFFRENGWVTIIS
ncbi:E3 ubiquitin/ISG15 ligase TRIM25 [Xenopus laevis]|uniref:E3 ubiquitin/ISG15 ligase TRIM25 n=2 Tax=Xenopus laevis TaxID=8355 RepID=A0A1L8FD78_XENLA|nr:E3 ubiquitin/ISG15 ligase TRIM25 [Xenopus laevis]XP_041429741.1 E3 ubiquitin/ISG15 ligase TRIM25 [Xenopus laevis]OCT69531.1 hypothetical protein XELAEV_18040842mg [Xenopus laevis]